MRGATVPPVTQWHSDALAQDPLEQAQDPPRPGSKLTPNRNSRISAPAPSLRSIIFITDQLRIQNILLHSVIKAIQTESEAELFNCCS